MWTNVVGKDRDVGYTMLRVSDDQEWQPWNLGNPLYNLALAPVFEWGIAIYDLELDEVKAGNKTKTELRRDLKAMGKRSPASSARTTSPPAVAALTGSFGPALAGTLTANAIRNIWAHAVIFCGHFPTGPTLHRGHDRGRDPR